MKWKIMVSAPYMLPEIDRFRSWFEEHDMELYVPDVKERLEESELLELISEFDGVICGDDRFSEAVYKKANRLKVISKWGTGIDAIHKDIAEQYGIKVYNTPDAFSHPLSDTVLAWMLSFSRNVIKQDCMMKSGGWEKIKGKTLSEQTLGTIGCGNIGSRVAKKASAFGMRILAYDVRELAKPLLEEYQIKQVEMDVLLEEADFISMNCDLNSSSFHLLSDKEFLKMKKSSIVINTARGSVIDEKALIKALKEREIAGAALDVFELEPLPIDSPLRSMENVILSSHNTNSSPKYWEIVHKSTLNNLLNGLKETEKGQDR